MKPKILSRMMVGIAVAAAAAVAFSPAAGSAPSAYFDLEFDAEQVRFAEASINGSTVVLRKGTGPRPGLLYAAMHSNDSSDAEVVMYAADGTPVAKYYLECAWPSKVEISGLKAGSSEVLYETVTLVAADIQRISP